MERESLNTSALSPHFHSRSGMLNHTGGTSSHNGMMEHQEFILRNGILEKILTPWNFKAGKSNSELRLVQEQPIPRSLQGGLLTLGP